MPKPSIFLLYIDPATTAYIIQIFAGIAISCGVAAGVFRTRIALFFKKMKITRAEKKILRENARKNRKD